MTSFQFRAIGPDRRTITGALDAPNVDAALSQLRARGALPISVKPAHSGTLRLTTTSNRMNAARETAFFSDIAVLLNAGLVLDQALDLVTTTAVDRNNRRLAGILRDQVRSGQPLSEAMRQSAVTFDPITLAMVQGGEASGKLGEAVSRLAELARQRQAASDRIRATLSYPVMVLIASLLTIGFLLAVVIPAFEPMFSGGGAEMPPSLQRLLWLRGFMADYGALLAVGVTRPLLLGQRLGRRPAIRRIADERLLALPWIGRLLAASDTARFSRALAGLIDAGQPLAGALPLARATIRNLALADAIAKTDEAVRAGRSLSSALAEMKAMPPLAANLLRVGEAAGEPAPMLMRIAALCERDVQNNTERLLRFLPALLIVVMGGVVAAIVSMLLGAVLDVNQVAL